MDELIKKMERFIILTTTNYSIPFMKIKSLIETTRLSLETAYLEGRNSLRLEIEESKKAMKDLHGD